jgi:hypothetical protein
MAGNPGHSLQRPLRSSQRGDRHRISRAGTCDAQECNLTPIWRPRGESILREVRGELHRPSFGIQLLHVNVEVLSWSTFPGKSHLIPLWGQARFDLKALQAGNGNAAQGHQ